jgi:hypothetical protein
LSVRGAQLLDFLFVLNVFDNGGEFHDWVSRAA